MILIPFFVFFGYVLGFCLIYGIPESLSESWYILPKNWKWLFPVILGFLSIFLLVIILQKHPTLASQIFIPLAIMGLIFVAIFSHYKDGFQNILHVGGAGSAVLFILIWQFKSFSFWIGITILLVTGIIIKIIELLTKEKYEFTDNTVFWLEMWMFLDFYICAFILYFT